MLKFDEVFESYMSQVNSFSEQSQISEWLRKLCDGSPVVLFGAALVGIKYAEALKYYHVEISRFCDNNKAGDINVEHGIPIISLAQLLQDFSDAYVVVSVGGHLYAELHDQLVEAGISEMQIVPENVCMALNARYIQEQHYVGYKWAYSFFKDLTSRKIILDKLGWLLLNKKMQAYAPVEEHYFLQSAIQLGEHEVFVDAGSFDGQTALDFAKRVCGKYEHIYCFEPDQKNIAHLELNASDLKNVTIVKKGLWSVTKQLCFSVRADKSSRVSEEGDSFVPVTSLDDFFESAPPLHIPTFIKMDIEGAENHALIGAKKIITSRRPKLVVCIYHKMEDFYELPQTIAEMNENYCFRLMHDTHYPLETVLYCTSR